MLLRALIIFFFFVVNCYADFPPVRWTEFDTSPSEYPTTIIMPAGSLSTVSTGLVVTFSGSESTTVSDTATIDLTLTGSDITGSVISSKDIVAGAGLSGGEDNVLPGADADTTLTFDATELDALTWDAGTLTAITWTWNTDTTDPTMTFENSGMIGIGTTNPTTTLDVIGTVTGASLTTGNGVAVDPLITFNGSDATDGTITWDESEDSFLFNYPITISGGSNTITFGNDETIDNVNDDFIEFQGVTGSDNTDIRVDLDGIYPIWDSPTDTRIGFVDIAIFDTNVGIGTTNPSSILDVVGTAEFDVTAFEIQTTTDSATAIQVLDADGGTPIVNIDTISERVGIGTTAPGLALDVVGTIEGDTITESGNAVYNATEVPGGELGGTFASFTIDDSVAVTSWNLTTPTITTSATMTDGATLGQAAGPLVAFDDSNNFLEITGADVGIGTTNPTHNLTISNGATSAGFLAINEDTDNGVNNATFTVPALAADTDYILPADDGDANQVLSTNGSGTLDWVDGGAGATYREITLLPESCVLDDTVPPGITIIESTGTATPRYRVADFDATTDEQIYFTFVMPSDYTASSSPIVDVYWYSNDVGPNETCYWGIQISATTEADVDTPAEQAADAVLLISEDVNETEANRLMLTSGTLTYATYMDGAVAGDLVTMVFYRDANHASDDLSSDARLVAVHLKIPRS